MSAQPLILLVDDERAITDNLAPFFERAGFRVTVAHDGDTALRLAAVRSREGKGTAFTLRLPLA